MNLANIENITLYTGDNGTEYCTCNCPGCSQKGKNRKYQGTISQAIQLLDNLPNLRQLYILGNPDPTVDLKFCNEVAKLATRKNIHVCFSTSGVGGKSAVKKLLKDIPKEMVDYISFSFDGTTKDEMSFAKGINYPMENALEGLEWTIENGYTIKIQPTLWSFNYNKIEEIISFYVSKGVKWFTFHIGSLEGGVNLLSHKHLTPEQVNKVHESIERAVKHFDIQVRCPVIYPECGNNDDTKYYCMHCERVKELLAVFTSEGIMVTHVPIISSVDERLSFILDDASKVYIPEFPESKICPFSYMLSGRNDTYCRYVSKFWNYPSMKRG